MADQIQVIELVMSLRYALGDMQGLNISDHELIEPINQAAHKLYSYLSERHVREVVAEKEYTVAANGGGIHSSGQWRGHPAGRDVYPNMSGIRHKQGESDG